jgi:hypothetical protein
MSRLLVVDARGSHIYALPVGLELGYLRRVTCAVWRIEI